MEKDRSTLEACNSKTTAKSEWKMRAIAKL